jgi:cell wall-associated NlpC family hydrolase
MDGLLVCLENVSSSPATSFRVEPGVWSDIIPEAECVLHSHPPGSAWPSQWDMQTQIATGVPWGILPDGDDEFFWGDSLDIAPLLGRHYRYGVNDCYSIIRDYLRAHMGIVLEPIAREWNWWKTGQDYFDQHWESWGWHEIDKHAEPILGDCYLFRLHSKVCNHIGVYVGAGQMLHHPGNNQPYDPSLLSVTVPLPRWRHAARRVLRHESQP